MPDNIKQQIYYSNLNFIKYIYNILFFYKNNILNNCLSCL